METTISRIEPTGRAESTVSRTTAWLAVAGAAVFLLLLGVLHVVKSELDPSWHFISEYAIGDHGWLMVIAFLSLAFGCAALFVAIRHEIGTRGGKVGLAFLLLAAVGLGIAAIFTADPVTATADEVTTHGTVHGVGTVLGTLGIPISAALMTRGLRRHPRWTDARRSLMAATVLAWVGLLTFELSFAIMVPGRELGPSVPIGWPNRFLIVTYAVWSMVVGGLALRRSGVRGKRVR